MLNIKRALAAVAVAAGAMGAVPASAVILGGINFDPALGGRHLETATLAQTFVNGNGQNAQAYGFITTVNGLNNYCAASPCGLFYVANFNNSQNFTQSYVEFTSATISVYFTGANPINLLGQNSVTNLGLISAMTPWLTLSGHNNLGGGADPFAVLNGVGTLTGVSLSGSGFGLFDVNQAGPGFADVKTGLDLNGEVDAIGGRADITLTSSFNNSVLNQNDVDSGLANGCTNGTASAGAWCYQGTSNLRGQPRANVPEPGMLGVLGLGMLGLFGFIRRRKS